ncbi:hypothetical protein EV401DRAFT_1884496 [Pisolithus croceorrhizus]|nr:hypothetical protein EV401DRAFT_1884496 [Pisolithus croceorrhizus]
MCQLYVWPGDRGWERLEVEAWLVVLAKLFPYYSQDHEEDLGCRQWVIPEGPREYLKEGRVGLVEFWRPEKTEVVGKKAKNKWEYHVTRVHKGPELSASGAWLVLYKGWQAGKEGLAFLTKQARNGTTQFLTDQEIAVGELVVDPDMCCAGEPNEGAINIAGGILPGLSKILDKIQRVGQVKPGFIAPACPGLGYHAGACMSQGWVACGPWGLKPGLDRGPLPNWPQLVHCALGQAWVWLDTDYLDSWLEFLVDYLTGATAQI